MLGGEWGGPPRLKRVQHYKGETIAGAGVLGFGCLGLFSLFKALGLTSKEPPLHAGLSRSEFFALTTSLRPQRLAMSPLRFLQLAKSNSLANSC